MAMAGSLVKNRVCKACGADIRPQALFCYNCGSSVAPEINSDGKSQTEVSDKVLDRAQTNGGEIETKVKTKSKNNLNRPISKPLDTPFEKKSSSSEQTKLKSAASLRKNAKTQPPSPKKVEVVWEAPENAPNVWFIIAALVLSLIAGGILLAVFFLR